jgi:hypothetical protein
MSKLMTAERGGMDLMPEMPSPSTNTCHRASKTVMAKDVDILAPFLEPIATETTGFLGWLDKALESMPGSSRATHEGIFMHPTQSVILISRPSPALALVCWRSLTLAHAAPRAGSRSCFSPRLSAVVGGLIASTFHLGQIPNARLRRSASGGSSWLSRRRHLCRSVYYHGDLWLGLVFFWHRWDVLGVVARRCLSACSR